MAVAEFYRTSFFIFKFSNLHIFKLAHFQICSFSNFQISTFSNITPVLTHFLLLLPYAFFQMRRAIVDIGHTPPMMGLTSSLPLGNNAITRFPSGQLWLKLPCSVIFFCTSGSSEKPSGCGPQPTFVICPFGLTSCKGRFLK